MAKTDFKSIDEYIAAFPEGRTSKLRELRGIIKGVLPEATEALKWNSPAFLDKDGMILVVFSGHKDHMNLVVTPSAKQAFEDELKDYKTGKGSVQLAYDKPLPKELIEKLVRCRAEEYRNSGVKWM